MTQIKILIKGYTSGETGGRSCSTITLIKDGDLNMIVDPGTVSDPQILLDALKNEKLSVEDIHIVGITHSHTDHYRNIGLFTKAKSIHAEGWWEGDFWSESDGQISDNIHFIKTPGHSDDSITFLVKTDEGTVAICGDVFWKENEPKEDRFATNSVKLKESRKKVLEIADWIIPGHGKMYSAYSKFKIQD